MTFHALKSILHPNHKSILLSLLLLSSLSSTIASNSTTLSEREIVTATATATVTASSTLDIIPTSKTNQISSPTSTSIIYDFSSFPAVTCNTTATANSTSDTIQDNSAEDQPRKGFCFHHLISHPMAAEDSEEVRLVSVELVKVGVTYIILYSTLATLLFLMSALVLLRHGLIRHKRRLPTAWIVGASLGLGLVGSILNCIFWSMMLSQDIEGNINDYYVASTALLVITPMVAQVSLILRLLSFYPPTLAESLKRKAIVTVPVVTTLARVGLIIAYLIGTRKALEKKGQDPSNLIFSEQVIALFQLLYTSAFLARKYRQMGQGKDHELLQRSKGKLWHRVKQWCYAIAFCFAFPTAFQAGLVGASSSSSVDGNQLGFILVANIYVQCFGSVLATLSVSHKWRDQRFTPPEAKKQPIRRSSMSQLESVRDFGNGTRRVSVPRSDSILQQTPDAVQAQIDAHEERRERLADIEFARSQGDLEYGLSLSTSPRLIQTTNSRRPETGDSDTTTSGEANSKFPFTSTSDSDSLVSDREGKLGDALYPSSRRPSLPPLLDQGEVSPLSSPRLSARSPHGQRRSLDVTLHPPSR